MTNTKLHTPPDSSLWNSIFYSKSIAVVGNTTPPKGASMYLSGLINQGYTGKVTVVSTDGGGGMGYDCVSSIEEITTPIDYAILCVSSRHISETVRRIAKKGVRAVHVFSSGFGDLETAEGWALQDDLGKAARETGVRVIGPNCLGVFSPAVGLTYPPGIFPGETGNIGMISQSGGMTQSIIWTGKQYGYRINKAVSLGNSVDLTVEDFLAHMKDDPAVQIVALYVEGARDGGLFIDLVRETSAKKPVVVLKAGMSEAGVKAASSHTGIMAGSSPVWEAALRQAGAVRVESYEEFAQTLSAFSKRHAGVGHRIALINRGGGEGVVAADLLPGIGLSVPAFTKKTREALAALIPSAGTGFGNPVDFSAVGGFPGIFEKMLDIVDEDENIDAIIYQHHTEFAYLFKQGYNQYLLDAVAAFAARAKKTVFVVIPLYYSGEEWLRSFIYLNERGISTHPTIEGAACAARNIALWKGRRKQ